LAKKRATPGKPGASKKNDGPVAHASCFQKHPSTRKNEKKKSFGVGGNIMTSRKLTNFDKGKKKDVRNEKRKKKKEVDPRRMLLTGKEKSTLERCDLLHEKRKKIFFHQQEKKGMGSYKLSK